MEQNYGLEPYGEDKVDLDAPDLSFETEVSDPSSLDFWNAFESNDDLFDEIAEELVAVIEEVEDRELTLTESEIVSLFPPKAVKNQFEEAREIMASFIETNPDAFTMLSAVYDRAGALHAACGGMEFGSFQQDTGFEIGFIPPSGVVNTEREHKNKHCKKCNGELKNKICVKCKKKAA